MLSSKELDKVCNLNDEMRKMLTLAIEKLGLSARWYYKILKVTRIIADLNNIENINQLLKKLLVIEKWISLSNRLK
ncbi:hypothetical protein AS144_07390 [Francisella endosymbiont of Amblyomma maculatum]|nr:hypothetical protein AS144_07390 [Francisella endosymbiont of Amblyomma maculatum]